jgi:hypothetical protein
MSSSTLSGRRSARIAIQQTVAESRLMMNRPNEGWGWPDQSRKAHYFRGGRSLCRKWIFLGRLPLEQGNDDSRSNCGACKKKRAQEKKDGCI